MEQIQAAEIKQQVTRMTPVRKFSDTVKENLQSSAHFRRALLGEAINCFVSGDLDTGKIVLREYINGTVGFIALGAALDKSPKSLMRMLSPEGNPHVRNLFSMVAYLQKAEGTVLRFEAIDAAA